MSEDRIVVDTTKPGFPKPVWVSFYKDAWRPFHKDERETWEQFEIRCQRDAERLKENALQGAWVWEPLR